MKSRPLVLSVFFMASLMGFSAYADRGTPPGLKPFSYRVRIPATELSCEQHAQEMAAVFANATQAQSVSGVCRARQMVTDQNSQYGVDIIIINYLSRREAIPTRAIFSGAESMGNPSPLAGLFQTYASCLEALSQQRAAFESRTELALVAGYCTASSLTSHPGYLLTLEGFGTPKKRLFVYENLNAGLLSPEYDSEIMRAATLAVTHEGGDVVWSDTSRLFYYASRPIGVFARNMASYAVATQCTDMLQRARNIFANANMASVSVFCKSYSVRERSFTTLSVVGAGRGYVQEDFGTNSARYESFEDCMGDLDRVIQNAISGGIRATGAICTPNLHAPGTFLAHLFFR